jgi:hypothetical protein
MDTGEIGLYRRPTEIIWAQNETRSDFILGSSLLRVQRKTGCCETRFLAFVTLVRLGPT